ncbi:SDR family NAD(P)-dependent oxidoreductase [Corallococcus exiguus]|uniref:SDR family NAD(P)-dependent oxidoreductase n=1 Tax=Corallococcus exiguus TaxID=83462 RepID=UPI00155FC24B|nr:SDR family NAD(P)-dependent oxidoreductase [Corallococcus exiguus]NRD52540.1 SDR family NAD(P)-dependent oxidoreductase [Corallococcus exiguus]
MTVESDKVATASSSPEPVGPARATGGLLTRRALRVVGARLEDGFTLTHDDPALRDHTVLGQRVLLGVTYASWVLEAGRRHFQERPPVGLRDLLFHQPLVLGPGGAARITVSVRDASFEVSFQLAPDAPPVRCATGTFLFDAGAGPAPTALDVARFQREATRTTQGANVYERMRQVSVAYGPSLFTVQRTFHRDGEVLGELAVAEESSAGSDCFVPPALLDGVIVAGAFEPLAARGRPCIPMFVERLVVHQSPGPRCVATSRVRLSNDEVLVLDARLHDASGRPLVELTGVTLKNVPALGNPFSTTTTPTVAIPAPSRAAVPPLAAGDEVARGVERRLRERIAAKLGVAVEQVDPSRNFMEAGLSSVALVEFMTALGTELGASLSPTLVFEFQSPRALALHLAREHASAFTQSLPSRAVSAPAAPAVEQARVAAPAVVPEPALDEPVAIVGLAGVFPGSKDLREFWEHLARGADLVTPVPADRPYLRIDGREPWRASFISGVDRFDAAFFGITPREAALMDPKQRLLLELVWQAIEDSGHCPSELRGSNTGLFVGVGALEYGAFQVRQQDTVEAYSATGIAGTMLPNRVSFLMDWHGPSEAIDTACSSSLVAIHRALESLRNGDCEQAVVGGINLILSPFLTLAFSRAGMLSEDGRCKTFDRSADGYVRGEGAGVFILKPLSKALADRDAIHAVIRGSAINHGGHANTLTAPNPRAQEQLLTRAYRKARVDPSTVSYVEAHGTGTKLGDPVETRALVNAFRSLASDAGSDLPARTCGLGSVKTNIGHLEAAAGVAGVVKVLLAFMHRKLPATVHFRAQNEYIALEGSPFYVVTETADWHRPAPSVPRRAGVSSFGFGGVNAHVVLEEFGGDSDAQASQAPAPEGPVVFLLSAKTRGALERSAAAMLEELDRRPSTGQEEARRWLHAVCHTLQVGREPMAHRLAVVVSHVEELRSRLKDFLRGTSAESTFVGDPATRSPALMEALEGEDGQDHVWRLLGKGRLDKVARLWVAGLDVDWARLHTGPLPRRLHLPTYSFERERHWDASLVRGGAARPASLHPLVDHVVPTLAADTLRYETTLTPDAPFLRDHVVGSHGVLPAVCYLEMAWRAFLLPENEGQRFSLSRVVLQQRLEVEAPVRVSIALTRGSGTTSFSISSLHPDGPVTHATGEYQPEAGTAPVERLDVEAVAARCSKELDGHEIYARLERAGLRYGPFFRCLQRMRTDGRESVGWLALPPEASEGFADYQLHPALLDAALHVVLGQVASAEGQGGAKRLLPFVVDAVEVLGPLAPAMAVYVKSEDGRCFDVALVAEDGRVAVKVHGLEARELKAEEAPLLYAPYFDAVRVDAAVASPVEKRGALIVYPDDAGELSRAWGEEIEERYTRTQALSFRDLEAGGLEPLLDGGFPLDSVFFLAPGTEAKSLEAVRAEDSRALYCLYDVVRTLDARGALAGPLDVLVFTVGALRTRADEPLLLTGAALGGFLRSLAGEYPHCRFRVVDLGAGQPLEDLRSDVLRRYLQAQGAELPEEVALRDGTLMQRRLGALDAPASEAPIFRQGGTYLIVGGLGGIGLALAEHLLGQRGARVALLGRSAPDEAMERGLQALRAHGGDVVFMQADVTDAASLRQAVARVKERFGAIHGVFHSALVLQDALLKKLDRARLQRVLAPKVAGSLVLAEVLAGEPLDFLVFFSSAVGISGGAGQSHYAAASRFQDALALLLSQSFPFPVKVIDWGFWGTVGAVATPEYNQLLREEGFGSIVPREGFRALEQVLGLPLPQVVAIKGDARVLGRIHASTRTVVSVQRDAGAALLAGVRQQVEAFARSRPEEPARRVVAAFELFEEYARRGLRRTLVDREPRADEVLPEQARLYRECLAIRARAAAGERPLEALRADVLTRLPDLAAYMDLLDRCVEALPDVWTGRRSSMDVMFPDGSTELVENVYASSLHSDLLNALTAEAVRAFVEARLAEQPGRPLVLVEVGAGTGGTTRFVLEALRPYAERVRYVFTDLSVHFLHKARERFRDSPVPVEYRTLDLERDADLEGVDLVLGTNVLHATADLGATLRRIKGMLRRHGLLVLNETIAARDFATLTFGTMKGWWLYRDEEHRIPGSPVVSRETWKMLLAREGFLGASACGLPGLSPGQEWQSVLLAQSDGIAVRAREARAPTAKPVVREAAPVRPATMSAPVTSPVEGGTRAYVKRVFAEVLKQSPGALGDDATFDAYGVDSLLGLEVRRRFEKDLGRLPSTLLFEQLTVRALAGYLEQHKAAELTRVVGTAGAASVPAPRQETVSFERRPSRGTPSEERPQQAESQDIAITGLSGRYPGAPTLDALLDNLRAGRSAFSAIPAARWNGAEGGVRHGAFLEDVDRFDPLFFSISPGEAEEMDPQERILLELALHALEDAGQPRGALLSQPLKAGVFIGAMNPDYEWLGARASAEGTPNRSSSRFWSIANRISYWFNLRGPSFAVDSACSASLTAIHLACQSLLRGECELALAGGVNLILHPDHLERLAHAGLLTKGDSTRSFGERADGFIDGEGAGLVVLKPLARARADGDLIHGVIKGSSINAGGKTAGYLAPNPQAQADVIDDALRRARVPARSISYVECAAAGSSMGDAIEVSGLKQAFARHTPEQGFCAVGSIKANVGHLESASGIAALTKVLLQFRTRELFPSPHAGTPNPELELADSAFRLQGGLAPWRPGPSQDGQEAPLRAGISAFGAGGANAHLIVEEYREARPRQGAATARPVLVPLSAKSAERLQAHARNLADHLSRHRDTLFDSDVASIAYTLQVGREPLEERAAFVVESLGELRESLDGFLSSKALPGLRTGHVRGTDEGPARDVGTARTRDALLQVAEQWVSGTRVDWRSLHEGTPPARLLLPGYPFARRRCWIGPAPVTPSHSSAPVETAVPARDAEALVAAVGEDLKDILCHVLKVRPEELSVEDDMSQYGLDSMRVVQMVEALNTRLGLDATPPLFYGHVSIQGFARTLHQKFESTLAAHYQGRAPVAPVPAPRAPAREVRAAPAAPVSTSEPIAIIGVSGVFPGSEDPQAFWEHLLQGHDLVTEVPSGRWNAEVLSKEAPALRWGGFMPGVDQFDPEFFGLSPQEARLMDPQHRLFIEAVWKAFEDAGQDPLSHWGERVGVFVGVANHDYTNLLLERQATAHMATGNAHAMLPNRVSYLLNFTGPSEPVDTACSSSLVAVRKAVEALQRGECTVAVAGGVNTLLSPNLYVAFNDAGMLSPNGRCRTFDSRADGYARGEGVGAVLLKPLRQAVEDGDPIYCVIKGAAMNHGGHTASITAPNPMAQRDVIVAAWEQAGLDPSSLGYLETHGTGTALGDPIELNALKDVFKEFARRRGQPVSTRKHCGIGAVKTNIGHLETAAGIAGLVKAALALKHGVLPKNAHFEKLNPYIQLDDSPLYILDETKPWEPLVGDDGASLPRRAAVSSFGFGGVNAHVVLEEYVAARPAVSAPDAGPFVVPVSAQTPEVLKASLGRLAAHLRANAGGAPAVPAHEGRAVLRDIAARILGVAEAALDEDELRVDLGFGAHALSRLVEEANARLGTTQQVKALASAQTLGAVFHAFAAPVASGSAGGLSLRDLAHTLQTGRMAMKERVAFVARDVPELTRLVDAFLRGEAGPAGAIHVGSAPAKGRFQGLRGGGQESAAQGAEALKPDALCARWVAGEDVDWRALNRSGPKPRRLSLPVYPFARKRYWFDEVPFEPSLEPRALGRATPAVEAPAKKEAAEEPGRELGLIRVALAAILGTQPDSIQDGVEFKDMGLDSIMTIKLVKQLNHALELSINPMQVIENQTLGKLSRLLVGMRPSAGAAGVA